MREREIVLVCWYVCEKEDLEIKHQITENDRHRFYIKMAHYQLSPASACYNTPVLLYIIIQREKEREKVYVLLCVGVFVCVFVCVREREREKGERETPV